MTAVVVLPQNARSYAVTVVAADTSSLKTVCTAAGTFLEINALQATSDDTSDRLLQIYVTIGGTDYLVGTVNIPTTAGTVSSIAPINLFTALQLFAYDSNGNKVLRLDNSVVLKVKTTTTVTSNKTVTITAMASEY